MTPTDTPSAGRWQTILAIDFDKHAAETYRANFPGVEVRTASVADEVARLPYADVLLGGPPCQPFSHAGKRDGKNDARDCVPDFLAAIERVKPRMFLMENVDGFMTIEGGRYCQRVFARMGEIGYVPDVQILDAVNFGVPQFRSRCWFWGIRADLYVAGIKHQWPKPTHVWPWPDQACMFGGDLLGAVTVGQALEIPGELAVWGGGRNHPADADGNYRRDKRDLTAEPCTTIADYNGATTPTLRYRWSDAMLQKHPPASPAPTVQAKYYKGGAEGLLEMPLCDDVMHRQYPQFSDEPAKTVVKAAGRPSTVVALDTQRPTKHDKTIMVRRLTPLECARLQSVADDFRWPEKITKTAMYRIVGNGQSSLMVYRIGEAMHAVDPESKTVIDLFCGGGIGATGLHGRFWSWSLR